MKDEKLIQQDKDLVRPGDGIPENEIPDPKAERPGGDDLPEPDPVDPEGEKPGNEMPEAKESYSSGRK